MFPRVPVRQWVLSLPMPLRFRLAPVQVIRGYGPPSLDG
jgi:hypothetical protein